MKQPKIAIVGTGVVGSTTAYNILLHHINCEIILVDSDKTKCQGELLDLSDGRIENNCPPIRVGSAKDAGQADIAIITAGIAQKPGQTRLELINTNYKIITSIIQEMKPLNPNLIIIMVTNPVDILTYVCQEIAGIARNQIFGSGTLLDTQRLRQLISQEISIDKQSIHCCVLGEHGDSQFVAWSSARIGGKPLSDFKQLDEKKLQTMAHEARLKAYKIIECKGSTAFGIASCIETYCSAILNNSKRILPVSCYLKEYNICMSVPAVLGAKGVEEIIIPPFTGQEEAAFKKSALAIKGYIDQLQ